tara:strand:- start:372 stop:605 length:234 start_codon:yes stop_codon:yes gene_type:complete
MQLHSASHSLAEYKVGTREDNVSSHRSTCRLLNQTADKGLKTKGRMIKEKVCCSASDLKIPDCSAIAFATRNPRHHV